MSIFFFKDSQDFKIIILTFY